MAVPDLCGVESTMTVQCLIGAVLVSLVLPLGNPPRAQAQTPEAPAQKVPVKPAPVPLATPVGSKWWIVGGGGFAMARAGCAMCDRAGVFTNTKSLFVDVGGRVSPRVDVGGEVMFVTARLEDGTAERRWRADRRCGSDPHNVHSRHRAVPAVGRSRPLPARGDGSRLRR